MNFYKSKRFWLIAGVLLIAIMIIYGLLPKPIAVEVTQADRGQIEVVVEEEGVTRVVDKFVVTAPVAGYAERLRLDVGDVVEEGGVLLSIEPMPAPALNPQARAEVNARVAGARATLSSAEENVAAAAAEAELATDELERIRNLFEADAATERDMDAADARARAANAQLTSSRFGVDVARHNVEAAQTALRFAGRSAGGQRVDVTSPVAGSILAIHHESEGVVSPGIPLLEVGDPNHLEVAVDVLSQDATRIEPGMKVRFLRWGGTGDLEGRVRVVEPVGFTKLSALGVEEQRVWVVIDFTSDAETWKRLGHGYRVIAEFELWRSDSALRVPASAVFGASGDWSVFVVRGGRAEKRMIELGHRGGLQYEILRGLEEGEDVIVHPPSGLTDGERVAPR